MFNQLKLTDRYGNPINVRGDFLERTIRGLSGYLDSDRFWSPAEMEKARKEADAEVEHARKMFEGTTEQDYDDLGYRFPRSMKELGLRYKNDIQLNSTVINLVASYTDQHDGRHDYPAGIKATVIQIYDGAFEGSVLIRFKDSRGCTTTIRRNIHEVKQ